MTRCARCLYDETVYPISFDEYGICNYCRIHDSLDAEYPTGDEGERRLQQIVARIREAGKRKKYDLIVGISGGCDSSYMLYLAKVVYGLRPLAVHFDNTWDSTTAVENIRNILSALDVDLYTNVVDNKEFDDLYRSFLAAGVIDIETPTDIGYAQVLNMACQEYGIRYMFEGHCFRTEGIAPLGWFYMDGKYIESVHKTYGARRLNTFPNMKLAAFLRAMLWSRIRKIRPLWYVDYNKRAAMELLNQRLGWKWYGGHHLENRFTAFLHTYVLPQRWGIDSRLLGYAALVRSGQLTREEGLRILEQPSPYDQELVGYVRKRLGYTAEELHHLMCLPHRTYRDFSTYKKTFECLRPFFKLMYKANRVPKSFYIKYCHPDPGISKLTLTLWQQATRVSANEIIAAGR